VTTQTAAQRRENESVEYETYLKDCPAVQLLANLSGRWVSLTISALGRQPGSLRYSELSRSIPGISYKMLTQTLRSLERDGILTRTVTPAVPVRVDYELTGLGRDLCDLLSAVRVWAEANIQQVTTARERYDARDDPSAA
jgi:DNA-binding HxlR family transcriptional regulator